MGVEGATRKVAESPTEGMRRGAGNRRSRRETGVDESREEMADRVARH